MPNPSLNLTDDAAFLAGNSLEWEVFLLTTSFTTCLTKPVSSGRLRALGSVVNRSKLPLAQAHGYAMPPDPSLKLTRSGKRGSIHAGCNAAGVAARKEEADER